MAGNASRWLGPKRRNAQGTSTPRYPTSVKLDKYREPAGWFRGARVPR